MDEPVRWGVLATGGIARSFARDLREVPGARLVAVGSRFQGSADRFAAEHGGRAHGSYRAVVEDPEVEVVYVATPHSLHLEDTLMALEAGKHVLCEKPLTLNRAEADAMVAAAAEHERFLMEAMWMACNPVIRAVLDGLRAGRFGTPRQVRAEIGFVVDVPPGHRLRDPALGAGALLDMGVYPLTFADLVLGPADELRATAVRDERGIDVDVAIAARHGDAVSVSTATMTSAAAGSATIATDTGRIELPPGFHHARHALWTPIGGQPERIDPPEPLLGSGLGNEAAEVGRCVRAGLRESPWVPHEQTLRLMDVMDDVRRQVGVRYEVDEQPTLG